jgi:hypothetical protein
MSVGIYDNLFYNKENNPRKKFNWNETIAELQRLEMVSWRTGRFNAGKKNYINEGCEDAGVEIEYLTEYLTGNELNKLLPFKKDKRIVNKSLNILGNYKNVYDRINQRFNKKNLLARRKNIFLKKSLDDHIKMIVFLYFQRSFNRKFENILTAILSYKLYDEIRFITLKVLPNPLEKFQKQDTQLVVDTLQPNPIQDALRYFNEHGNGMILHFRYLVYAMPSNFSKHRRKQWDTPGVNKHLILKEIYSTLDFYINRKMLEILKEQVGIENANALYNEFYIFITLFDEIEHFLITNFFNGDIDLFFNYKLNMPGIKYFDIHFLTNGCSFSKQRYWDRQLYKQEYQYSQFFDPFDTEENLTFLRSYDLDRYKLEFHKLAYMKKYKQYFL